MSKSFRPDPSFLSLNARGGGSKRRPPFGGMPNYIWFSVGGTTVLFGYAYFAFLDEAPITKRKRWIATSPQWEQQLGDQEYRQLMRRFRSDILPRNHRASITVQRVGSRIAEASIDFAQRHNLKTYSTNPYTYTVIRSDMANAFVLPGNHVFVMTGLFKYVRNEDELAGVLGHEVAHNLARHAGEKVSGSLVVSLLARLTLIIDPSGLFFSILVPAASLFRELPNSRQQETEADEIGVYLAAQACYDPRAAQRVFANMKKGMEGANHGPEFLSTHPSHENRIRNFDQWMPKAMETFESDDRCRMIREQMTEARQAAAREAALRETQSGWSPQK